MLRRMFRAAVIAALLIPAIAAARRLPAPSFERTLATHLAAISGRDLERLLATVDEAVTLILPNGKLLDGKAAFTRFHEEWFAEKTWSMTFRELRRVESRDLATVLLETEYRDVDAKGAAIVSKSYLAMTFRRSGTRWLLAHDQNTRLPQP
jgi:uncharacterized protein (TIGR02246 family)